MRQPLKHRNHTLRRSSSKAGLSLLEMLAVLFLIALATGLIAPRILNQLEESKVKASKSQLEMIATALDTYRLDVGRYPTQEQGLKALIEKPENVSGWNGPYLRKRTVPKDAWGQAFRYEIPPERGGIDFDLYSLGADGQEGGEDENADIGNWQS